MRRAPAARAAQPGRSWRCGSNYSAGREVGEDRRGRRRLGRGGCGVCSTAGLAARTLCSGPTHRGRGRSTRPGDRRRRRLSARRREHRARRRLFTCPESVAAAAGPSGDRGSRHGGGSRRPLYVVGGYGPGSAARNTAFAFHHGHGRRCPRCPRRAPRAVLRSSETNSMSSAASRVRAGSPATHSRSTSRRRAGRRSVVRGLASTSARPRSAAGSTSSPDGRAGSTPTRTSSRHSTRAADGGGRFPECRASAAAPRRRRWADGCSPPEARSPEERSEPCTRTRRHPAVDATPRMRTSRHGLGLVGWRGRAYALAGGPQPGLTVSGANEVLRLGS